MKRSTLLFFAGLLVCAAVVVALIRKDKIFGSNTTQDKTQYQWNETLVGVYDRSGKFDASQLDSLQFLSITMSKDMDESDAENYFDSLDKDKPVFLTIGTTGANGVDMINDFNEGEYDESVKAISKAISKKGVLFYVRWNPEMEVPSNQFPWQNQSSVGYVSAFQRFSRICKSGTPIVRIVWGPAAYPGTEEYWPAPEYVDITSVTLFAKSELSGNAYPPYKNAESAILRKLYRMRFSGKPVLVLVDKNHKTESDLGVAFSKALGKLHDEDSTIYSFIGKGSQRISRTTAKPKIGVYDPKLLLASSPAVNFEHFFIDMGNIKDGSFKKSFDEITARNHDVILTVEPWKDKVHTDSLSLQNVLKGLYDSEIRTLYQILKSTKQTVYLRFAHEMEIPIHRYPWQSQDPVTYIKAFRYFMNFDGPQKANIKRVWGPAGDRGSMEFWPGDDVVDFVSMAIYGLPDKNISDHSQQESFSAIYGRKYNRVRLANKPILITEFGVTGPEDFQLKWLGDASDVVNEHKEIYGISYFNLADNPKVWGNIPTPVWSISRKSFDHFASSITGSVQ